LEKREKEGRRGEKEEEEERSRMRERETLNFRSASFLLLLDDFVLACRSFLQARSLLVFFLFVCPNQSWLLLN